MGADALRIVSSWASQGSTVCVSHRTCPRSTQLHGRSPEFRCTVPLLQASSHPNVVER
jgi:hypothetical protein